MVDWRCNFIQSIDSHKSKSESSTTRGAQHWTTRPIDTYGVIDRVPEHEEQWLISQATSTLNTAPIELKLNTVVVEYMKKGLAQSHWIWSTTREELPVGRTGAPLSEICEFLIVWTIEKTVRSTNKGAHRLHRNDCSKKILLRVQSASTPKIRISTYLYRSTRLILTAQKGLNHWYKSLDESNWNWILNRCWSK